MFKLDFEFYEEVRIPDEYCLGWLTIKHDDLVLKSSELSGRGLMMVFFSLTSLLESLIQLKVSINKPIRFIGEDSAFILFFKRNNKNEVEIIYEKKTWPKLSFNEFSLQTWRLSESLFNKYSDKFEKGNIALVDWLNVRKEVWRKIIKDISE